MKNKLIDALKYFASSSLAVLLVFFLIRGYEILFVWNNILKHGIQLNFLFVSFLSETTIFFEIAAILGALFIILFLIHRKTSKIVLNISFTLTTVIYLLLDLYFTKTSIPLGSDLFGYSMFEINQTVTSAGGLNPIYFVLLVLFIGIVLGVIFLFQKIRFNFTVIKFYCTLIVLSLIFGTELTPQPQNYSNTSEYYLTINKLDFFTTKSYTYFFEKELELPVSNYYIDSGEGEEVFFKYTDSNYPFLHEENTKNILANFFNIGEKRPNLVFIITESLGRGYSGENAYMGSFTPFLDSLAKQSLYWENCLSTGGRTFAALPSIFGSLPFGTRGFLELNENQPAHFSLIKYLRKSGYKANFYYGGDARFDDMDRFLRKQNTDLIIDQNNFGNGYKKMPSSGSGFSWGYGDRDLFERSFKVINSGKQENQLNIFLTLSMHSPFIVDNQDRYRKQFDEIYSNLHLDPDVMISIKSYKDILSTVLYTDDAFRYFFNEFKKRDDFKNTIFIITGDHRMPEIPITTQVDRFHVPLIIYSPMLKRTAKFSSVSSHFDITPTLLAFLADQYKMEKISLSTFIGSGLDTARQFRNIHRYPLMRNKNELIDYLYGEYFYSDKTLYKIFRDLSIVSLDDKTIENKIGNEFADYRRRNNYMLQTKKLIPDSLLK
ncbi:MAG: LTA synthase family protein [Ignavibacteriales bacterium]|nr:LTA synthase family protein [Ignavibacteriales bacterium]